MCAVESLSLHSAQAVRQAQSTYLTLQCKRDGPEASLSWKEQYLNAELRCGKIRGTVSIPEVLKWP
jgi:hypothetical protein